MQRTILIIFCLVIIAVTQATGTRRHKHKDRFLEESIKKNKDENNDQTDEGDETTKKRRLKLDLESYHKIINNMIKNGAVIYPPFKWNSNEKKKDVNEYFPHKKYKSTTSKGRAQYIERDSQF